MTEEEKEDLRSISCSDVLSNLGYIGKRREQQQDLKTMK